MKIKISLALILSIICCTAVAAQSVVITPKKTTYRRAKPIADHKKTFVITYPVVRAPSRALSRKIESAISYKLNLGVDLADELNDTQWLEQATYEVIYNKDGILNVALSIEGSGAYPSGATEYVVVSTRTGVRQRPADLFRNIPGLVAMIDRDLKKEIERSIAEIKADKEIDYDEPATLFAEKRFDINDFDGVAISSSGIKIYYDYGFPHVIKALQPAGVFEYSWAQMSPYLNPSGLLAGFRR